MRRIYAVKADNGDVYGVPAEVVAENYARFYQDKGENYKENYETMLNWFDTNDFEFADWAKNNMDWDDVKDHAFLLEENKKPVDFQEMWVNGGYEYRKMEEQDGDTRIG